MKLKLKKLQDQVIVITGASSGIGLVTARMAAKAGAKLVLAARSEEALQKLVDEITAAGGQATYVVADVGQQGDVEKIADKALAVFARFDTWVNNAGVSIYGTLEEVSVEDMRRLFETNFWGLVYGSLTAARYLKEHCGAIINVGSTLSDRAIPLQGIYSASKHAVKGFTDSLRMELEAEKAPVSVTLVKPAAIDTPYPQHAKNYLPNEPKNPAPVYAPEVVAEIILHCAANPQRDVFAGAGGKMISAQGYYAPGLTDKYMERVTMKGQTTDRPRGHNGDGLYHASGELQERGRHPGRVFERSFYSRATLHPLITAAVVGAGIGLAVLLSASSGTSRMKKLRVRKR